ncbi:MAG: hypothetical protein ACOCVG_02390 [Verrucomicrobiota bacterium]
MDRTPLKYAIDRGIPFTLVTASGDRYRVPHRDHISISPKGTYVTVFDDDDGFYVLPLLTVVALESTTGERIENKG